MVHCCRAGVAFIVTCLLATVCWAKLPGADDPKAYTEAQYRRDLFAFNKRTMSEAYLRVGSRDDAWDDDAVRFLDGMAVRFANSRASVLSALPGQRADKDLLAEAQALVDSECDDPLVLYCYGTLLEEGGAPPKEVAERLYPACRGFLTREYPMFRRVRAMTRLNGKPPATGENGRSEVIAFWKQNVNNIAKGPECAGAGRRVILDLWLQSSSFDLFKIDQKANLAALLADPQADRWVAHAAAGSLAIQDAWKARGSGWASTVTEEGWRTFHAELAKASDHLQQAYAADPTLPDPAANMITVAMGAGHDLDVDARQWFDRAVQAQLDHKPAFVAYANALMPRWGGSHEAMLALAQECADAKRYDTELAFRFEELLNQIISDDPVAGPRFVASPRVYDIAAPVFAALDESVRPHGHGGYYLSYNLALEVKLRRYDQAKQTLDRIGAAVNARVLAAFNFTVNDAVGKTRAMTGPQGAPLRAIEARIMARDTATAVEDLKAVASALAAADPTDPGLPYVNEKILEYTFARDFAAGDWVSVQPTKELFGWRVLRGDWQVNERGDAVPTPPARSPQPGAPDPGGALLQFKGKLGARFAVELHIAGDAAVRGVLIAGMPPYPNAGLYFINAGQQKILVGTPGKHDQYPFDVPPAGADVLVEVWDGTYRVTVDGQRRGPDHPLPADALPGLILGDVRGLNDRPVAYSNVRVKRLLRKP
jgi:hypothetical protein